MYVLFDDKCFKKIKSTFEKIMQPSFSSEQLTFV